MQKKLLFVAAVITAVAACSSHNTLSPNQDGGGSTDTTVADTGFGACPGSGCSKSCTTAEPLQACCTCVAAPHADLARGINLHRFSSSDPTVDLGCLTRPGATGTPQNVKVSGYVWLFSSGLDSQGVKIEIFKEGDGGALGASVGSYTTSSSDAADPIDTSWSSKCQPDGCKFRQFSIDNVPTETRLIVKTSDAGSAQKWADLYDYNVYFSNSKVQGGKAAYDPSAVAATDINVVSGVVDKTLQAGRGLLAGEVHDCGDVRLAGATVEIDSDKDGPMYYFSEDESNPLPDLTNAQTSHLGLFGAFNVPTGTPIRVTAVGRSQGQFVLIGTYVVQAFPGAVTALSFRGRRPWQQ